MLNLQRGVPSLLVVLGIGLGCSSDDSTNRSADADLSKPDADPNAPDADPSAPDANPDALVDASPGTPDAIAVTGCTTQALELIGLVNDYRAENALPAIPASTSLCFVGSTHVDDLIDNSPNAPSACNMHSWSDQGAWSACCYTADHAQAQCMWDKPKELTLYTTSGYENAAGGSGNITPAQALNLWKGSAGHNDVILNQNGWSNRTWRALGVGIRGGYAVLWFGESVDPAN